MYTFHDFGVHTWAVFTSFPPPSFFSVSSNPHPFSLSNSQPLLQILFFHACTHTQPPESVCVGVIRGDWIVYQGFVPDSPSLAAVIVLSSSFRDGTLWDWVDINMSTSAVIVHVLLRWPWCCNLLIAASLPYIKDTISPQTSWFSGSFCHLFHDVPWALGIRTVEESVGLLAPTVCCSLYFEQR